MIYHVKKHTMLCKLNKARGVMNLKKTLKSLIIAGVLCSPLCAGELKVKNNAATPVQVTVRAKENQSGIKPFIIIQTIEPNEEITVTIDEKKYNGVTFSVQATTVTAPPIAPLTSNECILSGHEGAVVITPKSDGTALVCGVTQISNCH